MTEKTDQAESQRFMTGCTFVLVAIGFIILAFGLGVYTTWRQYQADPEGFEERLKEEYRQMEEKAEEKIRESSKMRGKQPSPNATRQVQIFTVAAEMTPILPPVLRSHRHLHMESPAPDALPQSTPDR